jgi:hypothetical protein
VACRSFRKLHAQAVAVDLWATPRTIPIHLNRALRTAKRLQVRDHSKRQN